MNVLESKHDTLQLLVEQLGINNRTSALLGLVASRVDPNGEDEELRNAFEELDASILQFGERLKLSVKKLTAEVNHE